MKIQTPIRISYKHSGSPLGKGEELRRTVNDLNLIHILREESEVKDDSTIYEIWFDTKGNAKTALKGVKKHLKDKNLWDKNKCEAYFKGAIWKVVYYKAVAELEIKDMDSISEEDI